MRAEVCATFLDGRSGKLIGKHTKKVVTTMSDLSGYFTNQSAFRKMSSGATMYWVEIEDNQQQEGDEGGLFFGISHLNAGDVGGEFFMTKGHVHQKRNTAEYYWGIRGNGLLLLEKVDGDSHLIEVKPGAVLYIPGNTAHRLINTGNEELAVGAVWQTSSGHNYGDGSALFHHRIFKNANGYEMLGV